MRDENVDRLQEVADRLAKGDERALEEALGELGPILERRLAIRFSSVLSREDIDDVLAKTLVRIWERREHYRPDRGAFALWCYIIARNIALNMVREKARFRDALSELWMETCGRRSSREAPIHGKAYEAVQRILAKMTPLDRDILLASVSDDDAWAVNFASQLPPNSRLSPNSLRQRRFRALAKLRKELTRLGFN